MSPKVVYVNKIHYLDFSLSRYNLILYKTANLIKMKPNYIEYTTGQILMWIPIAIFVENGLGTWKY